MRFFRIKKNKKNLHGPIEGPINSQFYNVAYNSSFISIHTTLKKTLHKRWLYCLQTMFFMWKCFHILLGLTVD